MKPQDAARAVEDEDTPQDGREPYAIREPTEVRPRATRRRFTAEYKLKVLAELDACGHGESGQILRREGLYSSHIEGWRQQRRNGQMAGLAPKKRGRKPSAGRTARLEMEVPRRDQPVTLRPPAAGRRLSVARCRRPQSR